MAECGTSSRYAEGCRCRPCKDHHAATARLRRERHRNGTASGFDRVPAGPSIEALLWLRVDAGLRWTQVEAICGIERRALYRILIPDRENVALSTERALLRTVERVRADPSLLVRDAKRLPAARPVWQVAALMAKGWTEDALEAQAGITMPRHTSRWVNRATHDTVDALFLDLHHRWGPSRATALGMWRKGVLPPDCYDWENGDTRPIPGTMHHDLVVEAVSYTSMYRSRSKPTRMMLQGLGQWTKPACARAAHRAWCLHVGVPYEDCMDELAAVCANETRLPVPWCTVSNHDHSVPALWRT